MSRRVTLRMVAEAAGVSVATASQALRRCGKTAHSTCARIRAVADELGYQPDPLLSRLASRRFHWEKEKAQTPVVLATGTEKRGVDFFKGLRDEFSAFGYHCTHQNIGSLEELRQQCGRWYHQGVQALVFRGFDQSAWLEDLDFSAFSVLCSGSRPTTHTFHTVKADVAAGVQMAYAAANAAGSRRIGIVLHRHAPQIADDWLRRGISLALLEQAPARRRGAPLALDFDSSREEQSSRLQSWLKQTKPDTVLGFMLAFELLEACGWTAEAGHRFIPVTQSIPCRIMGVRAPKTREMRTVVERVDQMIHFGERGRPDFPTVTLIPPEWIEIPTP